MLTHTSQRGTHSPTKAALPPDVNAVSLMRLPAVVTSCGIAKSTVWHLVRQGRFPQPMRFGRITAWRAADIAAWLTDPAAWQAVHSKDA